MKLKDLKPNVDNPRKITDKKLKQLKKSLDEFGDLSGFVFNRATQSLVGGHQRQKVLPAESEITIEFEHNPATKAGTIAEGHVTIAKEKFAYREVYWDQKKEKAANIAANKGGGEWDMPKLGEWFRDLREDNFDLDLTMFDDDERKQFFNDDEIEEGLTEDDAIPEQVESRCKLRDLWLLGDHRLLCGDSTDVLQVERLMGGENADMVFTDPPYGIKVKMNNPGTVCKETIMGDGNTNVAAYVFRYCLSLNIPMFIWGANHFAYDAKIPNSACWIIWNKQDGKHVDHADCELAWTNFKGPARVFKHLWDGFRKDSEKGEKKIHPTQKPVQLFVQIFDFFNFEKKIIDLFLGSGSTLIACEKTKRKCFGMEIDPHYCDVIIKRWEEYTGKQAILSSGRAAG